MNMLNEEEHDKAMDAYAFCLMLEEGIIEPITYNENTACLAYKPTGAVFTPGDWRNVVMLAEAQTKEKESPDVPKGYGPAS